MPVGGWDRDSTKVKGDDGTDEGQLIGVVSDRLKVTASSAPNSTYPVMPADNVIYKGVMMLDGSSKEMDVDGSSTAVEFDFTPGTGEVWYIEWFSIVIIDPGSMDATDFGSISGSLTNGLQFLVKTNGTEYEVANLKDNMDILLCFGGGAQGSEGDESFGFLDEDDWFSGMMSFKVPMKIDQSQGDYIRVKVRDNLTGLQNLRVGAHLWRVV